MRFPPFPAAILPLLLFPLACAHAQERGLEDCRGIESAVERLDCYDSLGTTDKPAPSIPAGEPQASTNSAPSAAQEQAVRDFGRPAPRVEEAGDGSRALQDTIVSIERLSPRRQEITLSSGQVWRQVEDKFYNLDEGAQVTIAPTRWGNNFRLSQEGVSGFIQVRRIR